MLGVDEVFVGCWVLGVKCWVLMKCLLGVKYWVLMKCLFGVVDLLDDSS